VPRPVAAGSLLRCALQRIAFLNERCSAAGCCLQGGSTLPGVHARLSSALRRIAFMRERRFAASCCS
jgi:hypothetical protein